MTSFLLFLIFIFGLLIGSMLNALVWRTHEGRSMLEKHSICPHCSHPLAWYDLIPLFSFIILRGKCRYCEKPISWQYPLVELMTGMLFVAMTLQVVGCRLWAIDTICLPSTTYNLQPWTLFSLTVALTSTSLLIALFVYDLKWGLLPNQWTLGGAAVALVATLTGTLLHQPLLWQPLSSSQFSVLSSQLIPTTDNRQLITAILSGLLAAAFFLLIAWASEKILKKPGMGMGDVKLALFMGLLLGFPGIIVALYAAFILGAVVSLLLIAAKRKKLSQAIPFGPFLVAGTFLALWLTPLVITWYQHIVL